MKLDIVLGAQYGNEGKSKFVRYYTEEVQMYEAAVKIGGYTKTSYYDRESNTVKVSQMIPVANNLEHPMYYIFPQCCYIDLEILRKEAKERNIALDHIIIDNKAIIHGTGDRRDTRTDRIHRKELEGFEICDVSEFLQSMDGDGEDDEYVFNVIVEAQGGYALAKDLQTYHDERLFMAAPTMTASGIVSLLDIPITTVRDIILVSRIGFDLRQFPSNKHLNVWNQLRRGIDYKYPIKPEISADPFLDKDLPYAIDTVKDAIYANDPSIMVLNFIDVAVPSAEESITDAINLVEKIETTMGTQFDYIGAGNRSVVRLENDKSDFYQMDEIYTKMTDEFVKAFIEEVDNNEGNITQHDEA